MNNKSTIAGSLLLVAILCITVIPVMDYADAVEGTGEYAGDRDPVLNEGRVIFDGTAYTGSTALRDALAEASDGEDYVMQLSGNVEWPLDGSHEINFWDDLPKIASLSITGLDDAVITFTGVGVEPLAMPLNDQRKIDYTKTVSFSNITFRDLTYYGYENGTSAWEFCYLNIDASASFDKCTFVDGIMVAGGNCTFTECTFKGEHNRWSDQNMYGAWVINGNASFIDSTFTGYRGLKTHETYKHQQTGIANDVKTLTVTGCLFKDLKEKPAINIDVVNQDTKIVITGSTFSGCIDGTKQNRIPFAVESNTAFKSFTFTFGNNMINPVEQGSEGDVSGNIETIIDFYENNKEIMSKPEIVISSGSSVSNTVLSTMAEKGYPLNVESESITISIPPADLGNITGALSVNLTVNEVTVDSIVGTAFDINMTVGGSAFGGGFNESVTVSIDVGSSPAGSVLKALCIDTGETFPCTVDGRIVSFNVPHFSTWAIISGYQPSEDVPPSITDEDDDYPFPPGHGPNQGSSTTTTKKSSDDTTKVLAAAAAVVVIMLAAVALMVNRNN